MERSKLILWVIVGIAAVFIVWKVGFYVPKPGLAERGAEPNTLMEPYEASEAEEPVGIDESELTFDVNEPNEPVEPNKLAELVEPVEPNEPNEPNEPMEAVNLKNVEMKDIIEKIAQWTGKVVIPTDEAMKQKVTIYSPKKLPRAKALSVIYGALRTKGYVVEQTDDTIYLRPIAEAKLGLVPTIPADQPLALIENKDQIVQKFFKLENYSAAQMGEVIQPLIGEHGYVSADETSGNLLVIDTVANLMRIERIVSEFDVPEAEQAVTEIFEVRHGDPAEIVQLLRMLLGDERGGRSLSAPRSGSTGGGPAARGDSKKGGMATSVVVGPSQVPVVLIAEPRRKWIIARASAEDIKQIEQWVRKLDRVEPVESEYETVPIVYADPREVAMRIEDAMGDMPGTELKPNVLVRPLEQSRQIMIFGRADLREMVKKLIQEVDIPSGEFETRVFQLKHADSDKIKENLDGLYEQQSTMFSGYRFRGYGQQTVSPTDTVKVISFPAMQQVTVIASPENIRKIAQQIKEWDIPLDVDQVKPLIIELHNSDPVQMADLLTSLFTEESGSRVSIYDVLFGRTEDKKKIVGPLYGQLTFEDVPGTKKIIVISKIPEAYDVIKDLVQELDRQEMAEVPKVVTINYADPEELAEHLNALFNELGTTATIRFTERGLSSYSMEETSDDSQSNSNQDTGTSNEYRPWWTTGRTSTDEEPISNVIGRVRFIPDTHSKSILVLAPPEFMDSIGEIIKELDIPGKQVMIKAVIIEVDHSSLTSLGLQLSSDSSKWSTLDGENAVTALSQLQFLQERGSLTLSVGTNVTALVDLLVKQVDAKILNQQTLWTKDNEEASFFKGDKVAFQTDLSISEVGGRATSSFNFERVGMTLRARPSITPEKNVDMIINVILSQLASDKINDQPVRTEMETTTNMIVQDGQTIMLGGILFQKDSTIERKVPLFGDVPVVGGLFRHNEVVVSNSEMIIFITPYVIGEPENILPETIEEIERPKERLQEVKDQLKEKLESLEQPAQ